MIDAPGATADAQLRWERRARELLSAISLTAAEAASIEAALQAAVDAVCACTGWPVGHVYRCVPDGTLASSHIWHVDDPAHFAGFRAISEAMSFRAHEGLPGRVLAAAHPVWIEDVTVDDNFPRGLRARDLGVHAAFGFPVLAQGQVWAVLEFFLPHTAPPDGPLLEVVATIGRQLGRVIERARAAEALQASELRLRTVTATALDAIVTADRNGRVMSWNRAAERMFGWTEAEMVGRSLSLIVPERLRGRHDAGIARVLAGGERHVIGRTVDLDGLRRDGTEVPLALSLAEFRLGESTFFTGILRDNTERRDSERALSRVAEQLAASERRAVAASRAKSAFLANVSHELRTPLNAILGFVGLLQRGRNLDAEQREHLATISRGGEHLLGLINDVLSLSKIEAGEWQLHPTPFDPRALLDTVRDMFQLRADARSLGLRFEAVDLPGWVEGDAGKLRQVLVNLVGNAVKFTREGGVAVRARWRGGSADFEVEDTGPGMGKDELARLFQPFTQAEAGVQAQEGTGLGLVISRQAVELMGGQLRVRSEPGRGSCFSFSVPLPAAGAPEQLRARRRVIGLAAGHEEVRVLVVDDSVDNRRLLARLLAAVGCRVEEAGSGEEGLARWERLRPQVVWMDMRMPGMDGYAATRALRAREHDLGLGHTVVVALTASAFEQDRARTLEAGCDEVVGKPFREEAIFDAMARLAGVRFEYEDIDAEAGEPERELSAARMAALPRPLLARLARALGDGDDLAARSAAVEAAAHDPALARELERRIAHFHFDELLRLLERMPGMPGMP